MNSSLVERIKQSECGKVSSNNMGKGSSIGKNRRRVMCLNHPGGVCVQVIRIPAISVWTVCCMGNGDIASGSRYVCTFGMQ